MTLPPNLHRPLSTSHDGVVPEDDRPRPTALLAPDAFKGTASASAVAAAMADGARSAGWDYDLCPLSDGGEGFAEVVVSAPAAGGGLPRARQNHTWVTGPLGAPVLAQWWLLDRMAVMESAVASGLPLAGGAAGNDPLGASTRGTGELLLAALGAGARRVLLGVGGSATTDGGRGALDAIEEAGGLGGAEVIVACDVETRFVDAAEQFGPQKGATPAQVVELRDRLTALAQEMRSRYGVDVARLRGGGAAGGLAGGLAALGAQLVPGFRVVAESVGFADRLRHADLVVTGEGRFDASSWSGKVVGGVVHAARGSGVPVLVVAGSVGPGGIDGGAQSGAPGGWWSGDGDPPVLVLSLTDRFGEALAMDDPAGSVQEVVAHALGELFGSDRS